MAVIQYLLNLWAFNHFLSKKIENFFSNSHIFFFQSRHMVDLPAQINWSIWDSLDRQSNNSYTAKNFILFKLPIDSLGQYKLFK